MDLDLSYGLFFVIYLASSGQVKSDLLITPASLDEIENSTVTFRCSNNGAGVVIRWLRNDVNICYFGIASCTELTPSNKTRLSCNCYKDSFNDTVLSLQISNISSEDHNTSFSCIVISLRYTMRRNVELFVKVKSDVNILPSTLDNVENSSATFRCSHNGNGIRIRWIRDDINICYFLIDSCIELINQTKSKLNCSCNEDSLNVTVVSLHISNISSADHNTSFSCGVISLTDEIREFATLLVKVPVKTLNISPVGNNIQISENTSYNFSCRSSYSRPTPEIIWIVKNQNDETLVMFGKQTNSTDTNGFTSAINTLDYRPNRAVNGWTICCVVKKTDVQTKEILSRVIKLNITYPPGSKLMINGLSMKGSYYVIDNNTGILTCSITGGNPKPFLTWKKCFYNENYSRTSSFHVTKRETNTLTWRANSHTDRSCTCQSIQMERNDSVSIDVNIMYPPSIPTITFYSLNVSDYINILLNEPMLLNCDSDSKPHSTYQWRSENFSNSLVPTNKTLVIQEVRKKDHGRYSCSAMNTMNSTDKVQTGIGSKTIELQVLYSPSIKNLEDKTFVEGSYLNITCPVLRGNPDETVFRWISEGNNIWSSQFLTIKNISRNDDMKYTSIVFNTMKPTGKLPVLGKDSETFHLFVEYFAAIRNFYVYGHSFQSNVTVDENENIKFICNVDSNPISNTSLSLRNGDLVFWTVSNGLNYTLNSATCLDAGTYFCNSRNKHNTGNDSTKHIYLFVKCTPRDNPFVPYKRNISSAKDVEAVLTFPLLAYPKPEVTWQKYSISNWSNLTSDSNIKIESSPSYLNLTIYNITEHHFGQYRLIITNNIGSYTQIFSINAKDRPNLPSGFQVIQELTTDNTATLQWFPAFDGGYPQHFILNYSKANQNKWLTRQIKDTGELMLNYTINGLTSDTVYYIVLQAMNRIGSSELSETLAFQTKVNKVSASTNTGAFIGAGLGSFVAILIIVALSVIGYKRLKVLKASLCDNQTSVNADRHQVLSTDESSVSNEYTDLDSSKRDFNAYDVVHLQSISTYEKLDTATQKSNTCSGMKDTNGPNAETSDYVNMRI